MVPVIQNNPYIDRIWSIDHHIKEVASQLRYQKFDIIIDLHKNLRSLHAWWLAGRPQRITFDKLNLEKWLHTTVGISTLTGCHLIDRYYDATKSIGILDDGLGMDVFISQEGQSFVQHILKEYPRYAVMIAGANYHTKRIPIEKMQEIIDSNHHIPWIILGGKDVENIGQELAKSNRQILNLCGKTSLDQSAAVLQHSIRVVTGDTGMMHMAAALQKPITMIWGSTHPCIGMYPYYGYKSNVTYLDVINKTISCQPCTKIGRHSCPLGHFKCMQHGYDATDISLSYP